MTKGPWKETAGRAVIAKLTAEEIATENAVLTIKECYLQRYNDNAELVIVTAEFPKKGLRLNKTQANALRSLVAAGHLPDTYSEITESFEGWEGLALPVFKKVNEWIDKKGGGEVVEATKLYPCAPGMYDKAVREWPAIEGSEKPASRRGGARGGKSKAK